MVGKMHETEEFRPSEEARLDQSMTSMDPILQASLKREQQQRLRKKLLYGGIVMGIIVAVLAVVFSNPADTDVTGKTPTNDPVVVAAKAEQIGAEGWKLWRSGNSSEAQSKFEEAVKVDPKNPHLWNGLGWSCVHLGKHDKAIESFNRCIKLERKHAGALNGLGQSYLFKREYDLAEPFLRRAAAMTKGPSAAEYGLARLYLLQGEFKKAKATLAKMKKKGLGELDVAQFDAMVEAAKGESLSDELKTNLEPSEVRPKENEVADDGKSAAERNGEGWGHFRSGNSRAAELSFRKALELAPDMEAAQNGLGFVLLNQGKTDEAKPLFEKLVKANPKGAGYVNGLGRCYEDAGDLDKAIKTWQTVETGKGPVTALTWGVARSLVQLERYEEAMPYLKRIKETGGRGAEGVDDLIAKCKAAEE